MDVTIVTVSDTNWNKSPAIYTLLHLNPRLKIVVNTEQNKIDKSYHTSATQGQHLLNN